MRRPASSILLLTTVLLAGSPVFAQIKPASSGARSFNAPAMRRFGSGFYRPNQPNQHDLPYERSEPHGLERPYDRD